MPITFEAGGEITGALVPDVVLNGGSLYINDSALGDITVNEGTLIMSNSQATDIVIASSNGTTAYINASSAQSLTATGGSLSQDLVVSALRIFDGGILSVNSTWRKCDVRGVIMGRATTSGSGIRYTDVENFRLEATCLRTAQEGAIFDTCIVGDVYLQILNPSAQTDNTFDGIDLIDCDRLNLFGSVRGAVDIANNPRYAIDVPTGNAAIDVWMALSGYQTGAINDPGVVVTVH